MVLNKRRRFLVFEANQFYDSTEVTQVENGEVSQGGTDDVVITVRLFDDASEAPLVNYTGVRMEVGYDGVSSPAVVSTGTAQGTTPNRNALFIAEPVGDGTEGYWRVAFHPKYGWDFESRPDEKIGVAVLVETLYGDPPQGYAQTEELDFNFAFLGSMLPKAITPTYFQSQWSFAQFRLPARRPRLAPLPLMPAPPWPRVRRARAPWAPRAAPRRLRAARQGSEKTLTKNICAFGPPGSHTFLVVSADGERPRPPCPPPRARTPHPVARQVRSSSAASTR